MSLGPYLGVHEPRDFSDEATPDNREAFAARWVKAFGGDYRNAVDVWRCAVDENAKRDLSRPYTPTKRVS